MLIMLGLLLLPHEGEINHPLPKPLKALVLQTLQLDKMVHAYSIH